jgi:hypothetical protein
MTPIDTGYTYYYRPDRVRMSRGNERTIVTAIYNRIAVDTSMIDIRHVIVDDNNRYVNDVNDSLNYCFTDEANIDQSSRAFVHDMVLSLLDEGCVAIVPVDTDFDPNETSSLGIKTLRVGKIESWAPEKVKVRLYNDKTGQEESVWVLKKYTTILENPFYAVMNEPSSTLQRLIRKLNILDAIDEKNASGKLDLIIQVPYTTVTDTRRQRAENRRKDIENQLVGSKYGIAYLDGTEKVIQLNRPVENNLMSQIEFLTKTLYGQLGMNETIMDCTADEKALNNYFHGVIEPIITWTVEEMRRKFLTKTAITQGHSIMYFRDSFKLIPVSQLGDIADKLGRNEIMASNEFRQILGLKPSDDPNADALRNKNMPIEDTDAEIQNDEGYAEDGGDMSMSDDSGEIMNQLLDELEQQIDDIVSGVVDEDTEEDEEDEPESS